MDNDPNQFSREAWEANAEVWDARMGDEGNDFVNTKIAPNGCVQLPQRRVRTQGGEVLCP
jgi:hypothetical protein